MSAHSPPPPDDAHAFVRAWTRPTAPPLVPELRLWLSDTVIDVWEASERWTGAVQEPPFWASAWPGSVALARWLLDAPERVRGLRVLDFAAGCGAAAVAAHRAGAAIVTANEIDPLAGAALALNAGENRAEIQVDIHDRIGELGPWDVVLCGDVCYERKMARRVRAWLGALADAGVRVYVADPGRAFLDHRGLAVVARYAIATDPALDTVAVRETVIYRIDGSAL